MSSVDKKGTLKNMYEVCVWSFAPEPLRRLSVQHYQDTILVKNLLTAVAQALCINKNSMQFFAIFEGPLLCPLRKLDENSMLHLPCQESLSIQKWSFDVEKEKNSLNSDMVALKMLRCQVLREIQEGKLKLSQEEIEKLEDCNSLMVERQAMDIIHSFKDYGVVTIENCEVITELTLTQVDLAKRECITLQLDLRGLTLITSNALCVIPWGRILTVGSGENIVEYKVYIQSQLMKWLRVKTRQADYLKATTSEIWKVIIQRHETQNNCSILKNKKSTACNISKVVYPYHMESFDEI